MFCTTYLFTFLLMIRYERYCNFTISHLYCLYLVISNIKGHTKHMKLNSGVDIHLLCMYRAF